MVEWSGWCSKNGTLGARIQNLRPLLHTKYISNTLGTNLTVENLFSALLPFLRTFAPIFKFEDATFFLKINAIDQFESHQLNRDSLGAFLGK